jgi:GT2 family glycosyltransferase
LPETLEKMLNVFEKEKSIDFAYCDYIEKARGVRKIVSLKENIFNSLACGIMFRKQLFEEIGLFDEELIFTEYDFLIKLFKKNKKGKYIPAPLYIYRRNKDSLTRNKDLIKKAIKQLEEKYGKNIIKKIRKY